MPALDSLAARFGAFTETRVLASAAALLSVFYVWHAAQFGDFIAEDSAITFAYSKNWVAGGGLTINPGEAPVEGYSNPTWMFLCAAFMLVGLFHEVWTPKLLGVALTLATFALAGATVRRLAPDAPRALALTPAAILASNASFVLWSVGGLENPIYAFFIALTGYWLARDIAEPARWPLAGLAAAGATMSRPEGVMYGIALAGAVLVRAATTRDARWAARSAASFVAPLVVYLAWHQLHFEDLAPNTFFAKSSHGSLPLTQRLTDLTTPGWVYTLNAITDGRLTWALLAALGVGVGRGMWARGLVYWALALPASVFFVLVSSGDWMMQYRLLTPFYVVLAVCAPAGLGALLDRPPEGSGPVVGKFAVAAATLGSLFLLSNAPAAAERALSKPSIAISWTLPLQKEIVRVLDLLDVPPEKSTLLVSDIGMPSYLANGRYRMIDMFGLTDRTVAHWIHDGDPIEHLWKYGFEDHQPAMLQVANPTAALWRLSEHPRFVDTFAPLTYPPPDPPVGVYLRRDLYRVPWEPAHTERPVIRSGSAFVHTLTSAPQPDGSLKLTVLFSVPAVSPSSPRIDLELTGRSTMTLNLPLWDGLPPHLLEPGHVYRASHRVRAPESVAPLVSARALGAELPSPIPVSHGPRELAPLPRPPRALVFTLDEPGGKNGAPKGMSLVTGPQALATVGLLAWPEGWRGARLDASEGGLVQLCTDPIAYAPRYRVISRVRVESIGQGEKEWKILNLLATAPGMPAKAVDTLRTPGAWWRVIDKTYAHAGPAGKPVSFCFEFTYGSGVLEIEELVVAPL
jgi:hypothetical protein